MSNTRRSVLLSLTLAACLPPSIASAQDLHPSRRPSPMGMARITLADGTYVRVVYGRPYKRDRDNIFGTKESKALTADEAAERLGIARERVAVVPPIVAAASDSSALRSKGGVQNSFMK